MASVTAAQAPSALHREPIDALLFDTANDRALWVRGTSFKARFDAAGATLIPFFGADAPQNYPLELRASTATLGGRPLEVRTSAGALLDGATVRIDRGAFVEVYELARDSLEQRFVFAGLPGAGELVVRMELTSELASSDSGTTLRFENELGWIDYGQAFAIDGAGARIELDSSLVDGVLELRVPASFVEHAELPLVIDPLITFDTVAATAHQEIHPDVAYDATTDRWCVVWTDVWSANDHDVFARLATGAYQLLNTLTIDFTSEMWTSPKVANDGGADEFLVVAAVVPSWSPRWSIHGRFVFPGPGTAGWAFQVSPADATDRFWPDIGGDPYDGAGTNFCVVWQHVQDQWNVDIEGRLVASDGTLPGGVIQFESSIDWHEHPSIANSVGEDVGDGTAAWTVTWQYRYSAYDHDIYAAQLRRTGQMLYSMLPIATSNRDETEPMAATILDSQYFGAPRTTMIVYEYERIPDRDIRAAVIDGGSLYPNVSLLSGFDPSTWTSDQRIPAVDSDGSQFLVGFVEYASPGAYDGNVWICDYYWSNGALVPCELRASLAGSGQLETDVAVHSMAASGGPRKRYLAACVYDGIGTSYDVVGGLWDGCGGGVVTSACAGDGTGAACPCGNNGASGRGCGNSANPSGALLTHTGDASVSADSFQLLASGMPATVTCLFFETANYNAAGFAFGDGKRCASGAAKRLPLKQASGGAASYPQSGDTAISAFTGVPVEGATRYYQAWYRDPDSFCTISTFNLSNALTVNWAP